MMIHAYIRWTYRDTVCHIPLWIVFQITGDAEHEYLGPDTHNTDRKHTFCTNTDTQPRELSSSHKANRMQYRF